MLLVDNSTTPSAIDASNLSPGQQRTTDQLLTARLGGVRQAALTITISGARGTDAFASHGQLQVNSTNPAPVAQITRTSDGGCSAPGGYTHSHAYPALSAAADQHTYSLGSMTPGNGVCVQFKIGLDAAAGNDLQAQKAGFTFTYRLEQTADGGS